MDESLIPQVKTLIERLAAAERLYDAIPDWDRLRLDGLQREISDINRERDALTAQVWGKA